MHRILIFLVCGLLVLTMLGCLGMSGSSSSRDSSLCPEGRDFVWASTVEDVILAEPIIFNKQVYVETRRGIVVLDAQTGTERWMSRQDLTNSSAHPTVGEDVVVVGTQHEIVVYDAETGKRLWHYDAMLQFPASFVISEERLYGALAFEKIVAFDISSGTILWKSSEPSKDHSFPDLVLSGENLLVLQARGWLYALDAQSGQLEWERHEEDGFSGFVSDGQAILVRGDEFIYNFELVNGDLLWKIPSGSKSGAQAGVSPILAGDQVIWIADDGALRSAGIQDGKMRWTTDTDAEIVASPLVVGDGKIWVRLVYPSDKLLSFDPETGGKLSETPAGNSIRRMIQEMPGPALDNGKLYWVVDKQVVACGLASD